MQTKFNISTKPLEASHKKSPILQRMKRQQLWKVKTHLHIANGKSPALGLRKESFKVKRILHQKKGLKMKACKAAQFSFGMDTTQASSNGMQPFTNFIEKDLPVGAINWSINSETDGSICSEPLAYMEGLENSDMQFNIDFSSARKASRMRTQSFDVPYEEFQEKGIKNFEDVAPISEAISSDSFETVSQCSFISVTEQLNALAITSPKNVAPNPPENINLPTPHPFVNVKGATWTTTMTPTFVNVPNFLEISQRIIDGKNVEMGQFTGLGGSYDFIHDAGFYNNLVAALT